MIAEFHISLHAHSGLLRLERKIPRTVFFAASILIFIAGIFAFSQSKILSNLFLLYTDASLRYSFQAQIAFSILTHYAFASNRSLCR